MKAEFRALIRAMGMQAENNQREHCGENMAYTEDDFLRVIQEGGLDRDEKDEAIANLRLRLQEKHRDFMKRVAEISRLRAHYECLYYENGACLLKGINKDGGLTKFCGCRMGADKAKWIKCQRRIRYLIKEAAEKEKQ